MVLLWMFTGVGSRKEDRFKLDEDPGPKSEYAYATLLYGEKFLLGVRVLGQSIKESGTKHDMVLVVTGDGVRMSTLKTLQNDGWRIMQVETISNPGKGPGKLGFPAKLSSVYTKLSVFNMVDYKRVVYVDADAILVANSDDMFGCPGFCAAMRHSEKFNSGIMVASPSAELFEDMMSKIETLPSYTGGEQGFLDSYYSDFANGPFFNPSVKYEDSVNTTMRMPTGYNADVGLYVLHSNKWVIPKEQIRIIHYSLGPVKPWQWWSSWVISNVNVWSELRKRLPRDSLGYKYGSNAQQEFCKTWMTLLPLIILTAVARRYLSKDVLMTISSTGPAGTSSNPGGPAVNARSIVPRRFAGLSILIGYVSLLSPLGFTILVIPYQTTAAWGWFLVEGWVVFGHFMLFGLYLVGCYHWGYRTAMSAQPSQRNAFGPRPWRTTLKTVLSAMAWIVLSPWVADLLLVHNFFAKVAISCVVGVVVNVGLTHAYASLAIRWFACGRSEAHVKSVDGV